MKITAKKLNRVALLMNRQSEMINEGWRNKAKLAHEQHDSNVSELEDRAELDFARLNGMIDVLCALRIRFLFSTIDRKYHLAFGEVKTNYEGVEWQ